MNPFLFFHLKDSTISNQASDILSHTEQVHLFQEQHLPVLITHPQCFVYCFNPAQRQACLAQGHTPHVCFLGDAINHSDLLPFLSNQLETFWFPSIEQTQQDPHLFVKQLECLHQPICISFSDIFNPGVASESSRIWLRTLLDLFNNPLILKEQELLNHSAFTVENRYLHQDGYRLWEYSIALGLFGDVIVEHYPDYLKYNMRTIFKNLECVSCIHQDPCIQRGLGYIMHQQGYQGCIGLNLLTKASEHPPNIE